MNAIAEPFHADPLWARARAMFARAVAAVGDAASIARLASLTPELQRRIVAWLCPLENIVRKLLLAEAAELRRAELARPTHAPRLIRIPLRGVAQHATLQDWSASLLARTSTNDAKECAAGAARSNLDTPHPETWNARFSLAPPRDPFAVPESRAPRVRALWGDQRGDTHAPAVAAEPPTALDTRVCHSPLHLARRFEALRRVLENPRPHVERLARVLARAVRRFPEIVRKFLLAPCRTNDYDPDDPRLAIEAIARALDAPDAFRNSS